MTADVRLAQPCLVVLVGAAGSGKSTWAARSFAPDQIVSSDRLRAVVGTGESDQAASGDAFALLEQIVRARMKRSLTTVIDSTGLDVAQRRAWREIASAAGVTPYLVVLDTPAALARARNAGRERVVPDHALASQRTSLAAQEAGFAGEGFSAVIRVSGSLKLTDLGTGSADAAAKAPSVRLVPKPLLEPSAEVAAGVLVSGARPEQTGMRFGLHVSSSVGLGTAPDEGLGAALRRIAVEADQAGLAGLWFMDHLRQIPQVGRAWEDLPEPYSVLAHLAAVTQRITLGTLVSPITFRHPSVLGKAVATLDVLSGGRAVCGLGLGWFAEEHRSHGLAFPSVAERYELLEDVLQFLPLLWGKGSPAFAGTRLQVPEALCYPRPVRGTVPLLVGGSGARRTLPLAAKYADACNLFGPPDVVARKVRVLRTACEAVGRDPAEVEVTHLSTVLIGRDAEELERLVAQLKPLREPEERFRSRVLAGTVDDHRGRIEALQAAGVDHVIVSLADVALPGAIDRYVALVDLVNAAHIG